MQWGAVVGWGGPGARRPSAGERAGGRQAHWPLAAATALYSAPVSSALNSFPRRNDIIPPPRGRTTEEEPDGGKSLLSSQEINAINNTGQRKNASSPLKLCLPQPETRRAFPNQSRQPAPGDSGQGTHTISLQPAMLYTDELTCHVQKPFNPKASGHVPIPAAEGLGNGSGSTCLHPNPSFAQPGPLLPTPTEPCGPHFPGAGTTGRESASATGSAGSLACSGAVRTLGKETVAAADSCPRPGSRRAELGCRGQRAGTGWPLRLPVCAKDTGRVGRHARPHTGQAACQGCVRACVCGALAASLGPGPVASLRGLAFPTPARGCTCHGGGEACFLFMVLEAFRSREP